MNDDELLIHFSQAAPRFAAAGLPPMDPNRMARRVRRRPDPLEAALAWYVLHNVSEFIRDFRPDSKLYTHVGPLLIRDELTKVTATDTFTVVAHAILIEGKTVGPGYVVTTFRSRFQEACRKDAQSTGGPSREDWFVRGATRRHRYFPEPLDFKVAELVLERLYRPPHSYRRADEPFPVPSWAEKLGVHREAVRSSIATVLDVIEALSDEEPWFAWSLARYNHQTTEHMAFHDRDANAAGPFGPRDPALAEATEQTIAQLEEMRNAGIQPDEALIARAFEILDRLGEFPDESVEFGR